MMEIMVAVVLGSVVGLFIYFYNDLVLKPKRVRLRLERQGIRGPAPSFLLGNIPEIKRIQSQKAQSITPKDHVPVAHDWHSTLFSHIVQWRQQYGNLSPLSCLASFSFLFSFFCFMLLGYDFWRTSVHKFHILQETLLSFFSVFDYVFYFLFIYVQFDFV